MKQLFNCLQARCAPDVQVSINGVQKLLHEQTLTELTTSHQPQLYFAFSADEHR